MDNFAMTDHHPLPVKVRLMGLPDDVAAVADHLDTNPEITVIERSRSYPNRRDNSDQVRVYLELTQD